MSFYSRSENALTPPSGADDNMVGSTGNLIEGQLEPESTHLDPVELRTSLTSPDQELSKEQASSSPIRTPKKRKVFLRQQSSPSPDDGSPPSNSKPSPSPENRYDTIEQTVQAHELTQQSSAALDSSPTLPSAHSEKETEKRVTKDRQSFGIARKPLPELPPDGN